MKMDNLKKILIVDDEKMNIISLTHSLKPQYEIIVAIDGTSAIEAAVKHMPDIILLDIVMPDMNGFDVLAKLKDSAVTMNIPVIFITGLNNAGDEEKGLSLGAVDYIVKPFNKSILKARIDTHLKMAEYISTIEKLCMLDALTGLPNRRGFDTRMNAEWEHAYREKKTLGLIMLDIDKFKMYNDTYGHPQGDILLQSVAGVITKTLNRPADFASRWGGEEFMVLLPNTGIGGTVNIAEQIRINIMDTNVPCAADGTNTSITVSLGVNSIIPDDDSTAAVFIAEVDKLLYTAKRNGRNQVFSSLSDENLQQETNN
jgi:diguanylate cyclase (GGDEF)-like protein